MLFVGGVEETLPPPLQPAATTVNNTNPPAAALRKGRAHGERAAICAASRFSTGVIASSGDKSRAGRSEIARRTDVWERRTTLG